MTTTPTTTRCRLPLPIGAPEQEQITVMITDLKDYLHGDGPVPEDEYGPVAGIEICIGNPGYWPTTRFIGERTTSLLEADGSTVVFPSLGIAVAHMILGNYSAEYLGLDEKLATSWTALKQRDTEPEPPEQSPADRLASYEAYDAQTLATAERAKSILDFTICDVTNDLLSPLLGPGLSELLARSRPFDVEHDRYRDGDREYSDGSREMQP